MRNCYFAILAALSLAGSLAGQPNSCTQWTVAGSYALAYDGTLIMTPPGATQPVAVPGAGLALVRIDPSGAMTSFGYQTVGGQVVSGPMPGSLEVNSDCTGTVNWAGGATAAAVILDGGNEIHSMVLQSPMGLPVINGRWKRLSRVWE